MVINNIIATNFQNKLEGWYERLAKLNEARNQGAKTDQQYKDELDALQKEYEGYVKDAQNQIEQFRDLGIIQGTQDNTYTQEPSSKGFAAMSQDTGEELNGRFTALQISNEAISQQMIIAVASLSAIVVVGNTIASDVAEIRSLVFTSAGYLEDMVRYARLTYVKLGGSLEDIANNTKNL